MRLAIETGPDSGTSAEVTSGRLVIGRGDDADVVLHDEKASRHHAAVEVQTDGTLLIRDLGSLNGTFVDGRRIDGPTDLRGGERIRIGDSTFVAGTASEAPTVAATTPTAAPTVASTRPATPPSAAASPPSPAAAPPPAPAPTAPPPAPFSGPGPATTERRVLRRSARRATIVAIIAGLLAIAVGVLALTGVIGGSNERSVAELVRDLEPSVLFVQARMSGQDVGSGSGWVIDADRGLIVTNEHVINGADTFDVAVGGEFRPATIVGVAPCDDLAVLRVEDTSGLETMQRADPGSVELGEDVVALGYPINFSLEDQLVATRGVVSIVETQLDSDQVAQDPTLRPYPDLVRTDTAINPGNSGGPLVDLDGRLVGVNTLGFPNLENTNYAIAVDRVNDVTATLIRGSSLGWVGFGLAFDPEVPAAIVTNAIAGTSADDAGFNAAAPVLVTAIDGAPVDSFSSYCEAVSEMERGSSATFTITGSVGAPTQDVNLVFE